MRTENARKKKIFIQANCQSHAIKNIFLTLERLEEKYDILPVKPVHLWKEEEKEDIFKKIQEADIFLNQPIFESNFGIFASDNLERHLNKDAQIISFPNLYFTGYHPQAMYLKDDDGKKVDGPFDYHDKNILKAYKNGQSIEEVEKIFFDEDFYPPEEIEKNLEQSLKDLEGREKFTTIKMSPIIRNRMKGKKLFHIFNHPTNEMMFILTNKILERLREDLLTYEEMQRFPNEMLGQIEFPIYKSVQKYFGITEEISLVNYKNEYSLRNMLDEYLKTYKDMKIKKEHKIPKRIVQYWNTDDIPEEIQQLMHSWEEMNSEFSYTLYNREKAVEFLNMHYGSEVTALFNIANLPAMQSDIFRVAYILKEGGIYVDAATRCVKNISGLIQSKSSLVLMRKWNNHIWNGFIASEADNQIVRSIFNNILLNMREQKINNIWLATGPGLFGQIINSLDNEQMEMLILKDQTKECKQYFDLVNDLKHKKDSHWSKKQQYIDIYSKAPKDSE